MEFVLSSDSVLNWSLFFFFNDTATTEIYTLSLHDALPIYFVHAHSYAKIGLQLGHAGRKGSTRLAWEGMDERSEEHTSELQSQSNLVCRLLLEKKKKQTRQTHCILRSCE